MMQSTDHSAGHGGAKPLGSDGPDRHGAASRPILRFVISALIVGILGLQMGAGSGAFMKLFGMGRASVWPFIDYALFREAHYPGEVLDTWLVRAQATSGKEVELSPLGVDWVMGVKVYLLTNAIADRDEESLLRWCKTYGEVSGDPLVSLELFETRYTLGRDGFTASAERSIGSLVLDPLPPTAEWPLGTEVTAE